ncbi:MAG: RDD family protein [Verrucomicrobiaceae bacterium]|nr:MAG: RDD family protein [Verrucomicrobiaceae bacterium]
MDQWYYTESGEQRGPVGEQEIKNLLSTHRINPSTLVWREGMPQWAPAGSIPTLEPSPYAAPVSESPSSIDWSGYTPSGPQVRPWVRFWARSADFLLYALVAGFFIGLILGVVAPELLTSINDTLFGILLLVFYNFVEPVFLCTLGSTPFKALFQIRVRNPDGSKLSYLQALRRTVSVWIRGIGLGIPLVSLITHIISYSRLTQNNITSWDASGNLVVSHREIAWWRWLILLGFFAGFILLVAAGNEA